MDQGRQTLSGKGHVVSILDFVGHEISVTTIQLYCGRVNVSPDSVQTNECGCVLTKLYKSREQAAFAERTKRQPQLRRYSATTCFPDFIEKKF